MARSSSEGAELIYALAEKFKQAALLRADSLLTPGRPIWSSAGLNELHQCFVLRPDSSSASFDDKLAKQLEGAGDEAVQLMAEIMLVHVLVTDNISGTRKRELLKSILSRMTRKTSLPADIDRVLDYGISWPGTFFNTGRDHQIRFLITWMRAWRELPAETAQGLLKDPWAFKGQLWSVELGSAGLQRNAVLHLLFPDTFERIISPRHKKAVTDAFAGLVGGEEHALVPDEDRAILDIRAELAKAYGEDFDFYDTAGVKEQWRKKPTPPPPPEVALLDRLLRYFPKWEGFSDSRYLKEERDYKIRAAELAASLLGRDQLKELMDQGDYAGVVERTRKVAQATNMLWLRAPRDGDLALLERPEFDPESFAHALFDLLHGEGTSPERLSRFFAYTAERGLPSKWAFPTYLLMLMSPKTDFFVKPEATRWFLRQIEAGFDLPYKPSSEVYERLLQVVEELKEDLAAYNPQDLLDVQGYIWIAHDAPEPKDLGAPFDGIFADWDSAQWAFELLREALSKLGIEGPGDLRMAVSLRTRGAIHLTFGSWLILGFGREKGKPHSAVIPLRDSSGLFPDAFAYEPFAASSTARLRTLPLEELRASWESARPEVYDALEEAGGLFETHAATQYRIHNQAEIEAAVFDQAKRDELLKQGLETSPDSSRSVYGYLAESGFHFPDWLVTDYLLSLATKPFVILSGISGTGKTKLAQLVSRFMAPDEEVETVVAPESFEADEGLALVQVPYSALAHRRLTIPAALVEAFAIPEASTSSDFTVRVDGQSWPARLYVHPSGHNVQVHMKPGLYGWFKAHVNEGDYLGMRVNPAEGIPDFDLELRTMPAERRPERRPSGRVAFLSVRPDWTDNRGLLGYYNPLMQEYVPTELLRLLLRAQANPDEPHFVILDEMNLAKVEYYFSDFLSAMEAETEMVLHDAAEDQYLDLGGSSVPVPRRLRVPANVFFTGTVNVDETTYMFSPKVLDRANTIEFNEVHLETYGERAPKDFSEFRLREGVGLEDLLVQSKPSSEHCKSLPAAYKDHLQRLHALLEVHHLHFGYRVANEVSRYLLLAAEFVGSDSLDTAFDLQVLQKVLPKLAGNRGRLERPLWDLLQWCVDPAGEEGPASSVQLDSALVHDAVYPRSAAKLARMLRTLQAVGFVSFVE